MKVKLDDKHYFNSDAYCCWISCEYQTQKGKKCERRVSGYCKDFITAIDNYIDKRIKNSTSCDISEIRALVQEIRQTVYGWESKYVDCKRKK